jgi:hypothetical protein
MVVLRFTFWFNALSKEVLKSNIRKHGQTEKQRWEEAEKRKRQKKDDAGAYKRHDSNVL